MKRETELEGTVTENLSFEECISTLFANSDSQQQPDEKKNSNSKSYTIGLIVPDITDSFSLKVTKAIEDEAQKKGYTVICVTSGNDINKSVELVSLLSKDPIDGFIIMAENDSEEELIKLHKRGVSFIAIDRHFTDKQISYVTTDNYNATLKAISHLHENGRKNIAYIGYNTFQLHLLERKRAFMKGSNNGSPVFEVNKEYAEKEVQESIAKLIESDQPVDALFFSSSQLAVYALKYMRKLMAYIPENITIVAFEESDAYDLFNAPVTYIKQPVQTLANSAISALLSKINNINHHFNLKLEAELVVR